MRATRRIATTLVASACLVGTALVVPLPSIAGATPRRSAAAPHAAISPAAIPRDFVVVTAPRPGIDSRPAGWKAAPAPHTLHSLEYGTGHRHLDLFLPDARRFPGARPVIVWLHPGGWTAGSRLFTSDVIQRQIARGFAVASVEYRLAPEHHFPAPLQDVKLAILWLKAHGAQYHLDANAVIVAGGSAGGHLAALAGVTPGRFEPPNIPAALRAHDDSVAAIIDFVGPTDLVAFDHESGLIGPVSRPMGAALLGCPNPPSGIDCPAGLERSASIAPYVSRSSPPIFMAYGALDTLVPPAAQAIPLARQWAVAHGGYNVWVEIVPAGGHNLSVTEVNDSALDRFLVHVLNGTVH